MSEHDCTTTPTNELTAEYLRSVLHYDPETGTFTWKVSTGPRVRPGEVAGVAPNNKGYFHIQIHNRTYKLHRLAWLYVYGEWPKLDTDHINRDRADNRIANLRDISHKQNGQNRKSSRNNTSGHAGVSWYKQTSKWKAKICHNYRSISLGYFATIEEAVAARKAGELKYWGHHRAD